MGGGGGGGREGGILYKGFSEVEVGSERLEEDWSQKERQQYLDKGLSTLRYEGKVLEARPQQEGGLSSAWPSTKDPTAVQASDTLHYYKQFNRLKK